MKKQLYTLGVCLLLSFAVQAQAPQAFNYQGIARNADGNIIAQQKVRLRFTVHNTTATGTTVYQEVHQVETNAFGHFNILIGKGQATGSAFSAVNWGNGDKYLQTEIDINGGTSYTDMGATQLLSVPYALYAANPGPKGDKGDKGEAGPQGIPGVVGPVGATGPAGAKGDKGDAGPQGVQGAVGPVGAIGPVGAKGDKGDAGPQGIPGIAGPVGATGAVGAKGDKGDAGPQGEQGIEGPAGPQGSQGDTGPQGIRGLQGFNGPAGPAGPQGPQGVPGPIGPIGVAGPAGAAGGVGPAGPAGPAGPVGPAGPQGPAGDVTGVAGGDLTGNYPNPLVAKLQGIPVINTVPTTGQYLKFDGVNWGPSSISGGGGGFTLPFTSTENNAATLFSLTNQGDGTSLEGVNNTTSSSIAAVRGIVNSTAPGGFSSAVRGINNGTGGLGIGVWGSQAGSGWGVYGVTPSGLGVYGNSSGAGYGVYANSNTGIGLNATSTNGIAANISISNNANSNNVLNASTLGNGTVVNVSTSGNGIGVLSSTGAGFGVQGITSAVTSAGVVGDNNGGGEAVVGRTTSNIAGAVVGRNDGGGYGVRGFISTSTSSTGIGVYGQVGLNSSTGRAGRFENTNQVNIDANTLEVVTNGNGNIPDNTLGNAASFLVNNTNSVAAAVRGEVNTIFGNFGAAGVFGKTSGTGGFAGLFHAANVSGNGAAVVAITDGNGNAITANAGKNGNAVEANIDGNGNALYAWVPTFAEGRAGRFEIFNEDNENEVITVKTVGNGTAGSFKVDRTTGTSPAVKGEVNSIFANFGTAGVYGLSSGTGGYAGLFYSSNPAGNGPALLALTEGSGNGITANAGGSGDGVEATCDGTGNAIYGWIPNFGSGKAGRFSNFNAANGQPTVQISTNGTGAALLVNHTGASGNAATFQSAGANVARINKAGRGFFNGGTQNSGADVAEAFDVTGSVSSYEPGDVLVIATSGDRTVEKSGAPYSSLVAGVYATKPGVLLTEEDIDADLSQKVPMGVIGVIPTKICNENGPVQRGDMLVTASKPGYAMKADADKIRMGQAIGKALENFNGITGKIKVLVSIK